MSEVLKGKGIVWGAQGVAYTAGITSSSSTVFHESVKLSRTSDKKDVTNDAGEAVGQVFYNKKKTFRATVKPYGTSSTAAKASYQAWSALSPGTKVTITDSNIAAFGGDYNLLSVEPSRTSDGIGVLDVELETFDDNDVTGTIA